MTGTKSFHSICAWTFNSGKGGFTPANMRPSWSKDKLDTVGKIEIINKQIAPRLPDHIALGFEMHYDYEYDERNASEIVDALVQNKVHLAMATPGAHAHFAYGGIASLDPNERILAEEVGYRALELTYNPLQKAWYLDPALAPVFVLWNGSYGYDIATIGIAEMYRNLKDSVAKLCLLEEQIGGRLFIGLEPKPNEGHPAMLIPTVASALVFWRRLEEEYGIKRDRKGVNKEFGHSEMIGLDHVYDTVEELDNSAMVHMHINSQGYNDGIILGGPGKFDIDHGARINGMNIAIAGLLDQYGYSRWKGHDMQPRAYDNEEQAVDRIVRSILSWDACEQAARKLDSKTLLINLSERRTADAEDIMRHAVSDAQAIFDAMYKG
jgi:xylose isomerase